MSQCFIWRWCIHLVPRFAVSRGAVAYITDMSKGLQAFVAERRTRVGPYDSDPFAYGARLQAAAAQQRQGPSAPFIPTPIINAITGAAVAVVRGGGGGARTDEAAGGGDSNAINTPNAMTPSHSFTATAIRDNVAAAAAVVAAGAASATPMDSNAPASSMAPSAVQAASTMGDRWSQRGGSREAAPKMIRIPSRNRGTIPGRPQRASTEIITGAGGAPAASSAAAPAGRGGAGSGFAAAMAAPPPRTVYWRGAESARRVLFFGRRPVDRVQRCGIAILVTSLLAAVARHVMAGKRKTHAGGRVRSQRRPAQREQGSLGEFSGDMLM